MKVGLFDSGLGGLTVVKSVLEELKGIDLNDGKSAKS